MATAVDHKPELLRALPGDDVRQIQWRFAGRYDIQMLVQATRAVARGPVARLVAAGARNTHAWTEAKQSLLRQDGLITKRELDEAGGIEKSSSPSSRCARST